MVGALRNLSTSVGHQAASMDAREAQGDGEEAQVREAGCT